MISLGAVIAGNVMDGSNGGILPALIAAMGVTFIIGMVNGLGVNLIRIPPLVMTLGMTSVIQGGLVVFSRGIPSGNAAPTLMNFINQPVVFGIQGFCSSGWCSSSAWCSWLRATASASRSMRLEPTRKQLVWWGCQSKPFGPSSSVLSGALAGLTVFLLSVTQATHSLV